MPTQSEAEKVTHGSFERLHHKFVSAKCQIHSAKPNNGLPLVANDITVTNVSNKWNPRGWESLSSSRSSTLPQRGISALSAWPNKNVKLFPYLVLKVGVLEF